ncbi:MAG: aminoacyl-tRNA deacylase [Bacilli bacterium]
MNFKTNVLRILDKAKVSYLTYDFSNKEMTNAVDMANYLKVNPLTFFKTLVTYSPHSKEYYVFVVSSSNELDLKKCAKSVNEKSVEMIPQKDLLKVTGYIHGGCSPLGMKKEFVTTFDDEILNHEEIIFSAGKIGHAIKVKVIDLKKVINYKVNDLII